MQMDAEVKDTVQKVPEWQTMFLVLMFAIVMSCSFLLYGCLKGRFLEAYQVGLTGCVLLLPVWILMRSRERTAILDSRVFLCGIFSFLEATTVILMSVYVNTCFLWLIGCILLTAVFTTEIGIAFFLYFACLFSFINRATLTYELFLFIAGLLLCLSVALIKRKKKLLVVLLAGFGSYTVPYLILTKGSVEILALPSLIACAGVLAALAVANGVYYRLYLRDKEVFDDIVRGDYPLLVAMRKYSKSLCVHCVDVSEFSLRAAHLVGANEKLCRAGGLYHELGRILGEDAGDYVENGILLAKRNHFPKNVIDLIRQHNVTYEYPQSKEAAIIMLTDTIFSSMDFMHKDIEKNKKKGGRDENDHREEGKYSEELLKKLVDHVFERRIAEGALADSGLSDKEIEKLKQFYMKNSF